MHQDLGNKTIRNAKLQYLVTQWIQSYNHLERHPLYSYKFNLQNILPLPQNFIINAILYAFYATFPFLIEDLTADSKIQTSFELKKFYSQQFYQGKWKKEFIFQFTMIYLTKTISWFIEDHFPNLEINENLESQIFIILFKVLIGAEVGTKIYNVTAKKYVQILDGKVSKKVDIKVSISQSMHKKSTPFTMDHTMKQSFQYIRQQIQRDSFGMGTMQKIPQAFQTPYKSLQKPDQNSTAKRYLAKNRISLLRSRMQIPQQKSTFSIFNQQLKTQLRVDAFKKAAEMKYDIGDYQEMKIAVKQKYKQKRDYDPIEEARKQKRHKTNQINSGKISQSMQVNLHLYKQQQTKSHTKFYYPLNNNILSGKKLNISRQMSFKNIYTHPVQKAHSLCENSAIDIVERKTDKEGELNTRLMILPYKNRNKSQTKLTIQEWNQLLKEMKINTENPDNKEHHLDNKKSFIQHKQSNVEELFQTQQPKTRNLSYQRQTHQPFSSNQNTNPMTLKLKPQLNQNRQKSISRGNLKDDEQNEFRKIDIFTATSGETFQMPQRQEQNTKIKSRTINMGKKSNFLQGERLHKKSKTRIIRQSKIQFEIECKKRQQSLHDAILYSELAAKNAIS